MLFGVDYYPEQWESEMLEDDLNNIVELGCNVIRIGEFSWHMMEKNEGEYDFSFFDNVIKKAKEKGLKVIMGTPTATIPAWLAKKNPDILSEFEDGNKRVFGGRHVYCFNSSAMYEYSKRIITEEIKHFKDEKNIIAWQIDNEFGHEGSDICYCDKCKKAFQKYLSKKFGGNIERLNNTYGTTFWSQEYNDFSEIPIPMKTITTHNPALRMDWERFRKKSVTDFAAFQVDLIKNIKPDAVVVHDFPGGGLDKHCDYSDVARYLDKAAYNNYPVWGGQKVPIKPHEIAFGLDYIRGLKREDFWITEAIMGAQGHDITGFLPRPGQAEMWSCQGVARGASALIYFRYRGAVKGAEQFCYGILDADNVKGRKFNEVKRFFKEASKYTKQLEEPIKSDVAMIYDYDSLAAFRIQKQSILLDCHEEMKKLYKPFYDRNVFVDIIPSDMDFSGYKVLLVPLMIIWKPDIGQRIKQFAENGGVVVMTYRCAVKNDDNNLVLGAALPIGYSEILGIKIAETESLQETEAFPIKGCGVFDEKTGYGGIFRDMITASKRAQVLYRYADKFYKDFAAVTKTNCEKGSIYYLGCSLDDNSLNSVIKMILKDTKINTVVSPCGVEVINRGEQSDKIQIVINHNDDAAEWDNIQLKPFEYVIRNI